MLQTVVADVTPQEETADVSETTAACGSSFSCAAAAALAADTMTAAANHG